MFLNEVFTRTIGLMLCIILGNSVTGMRNAGSGSPAAVSFCHNGRVHGFSHAACPGGIRFKKPFTPQENCLCLNGFYHARNQETSHVIHGQKHCTVYRDRDTEGSPDKLYHLVPLSNFENPYDRTISFWNDFNLEDESFRRHSFSASDEVIETGPSEFMHLAGSEDIHEFQVDNLCYEVNPMKNLHQDSAYRLAIAMRHRQDGLKTSVKLGCDQSAKKVSPKTASPTVDFNRQLDSCTISPECVQDPAYFIKSSPLDGDASNHLRRKRATPVADIEMNAANEHQQLAEYILRINSGQVYPLTPVTNKMTILEICKNILKAAIPKSVFPIKLLDDAYNHFLYLYFEKDVNDLSDTVYADMTYALRQCLEQTRTFTFKMSPACPPVLEGYDYVPVAGSSFTKPQNVTPVVLDDRKYVKEKNDPIVEIMWKAVDFAHSYCFESFENHVNLFHQFEVEMERLFLRQEIQERWFRDIPNMNVYQIILPYNNLPNEIDILDRIVGSVHFGRVYGNWLKKATTVYTRKKREIDLGRDPYSEFEIWNGLAYCLQTNDDPSLTTKDNSTWGLLPNLGELNAYLALESSYSNL